MAFPNDLSDVAVFKIHPAIGCARLANNDDYYEFFDYEDKRQAGQGQTLEYMSLRNGKRWIKRQAIRFRLFAYGADGHELGELTSAAMTALGVSATWSANVANRKLYVWSGGTTPTVDAQASAGLGETKRLEGNNPWREGKVWLGDITGDGLFIPSKGGVYRRNQNQKIPPYGQHRTDNGILDTTCDGAINASLTGAGAIPVVPACVIVAPQDHSPDVGPGDIRDATNKDFVEETRRMLGIPAAGTLPGRGYAMDISMMKTLNAQYNPGMEICLDGDVALPDPASAFLPRGQQHIHPNEIRPSYEPGHASHGQLTAGLCSAWQTDLNACLDYWTSTYPDMLEFDSAPTPRHLSRAKFSSANPRVTDPEWLNVHIDMMEIARNKDSDVSFLYGTERTAGDDTGSTPVAPFPLEPQK